MTSTLKKNYQLMNKVSKCAREKTNIAAFNTLYIVQKRGCITTSQPYCKVFEFIMTKI